MVTKADDSTLRYFSINITIKLYYVYYNYEQHAHIQIRDVQAKGEAISSTERRLKTDLHTNTMKTEIL